MTRRTLIASDGVRLAYRVDDFTPPWRQPQTLIMLHSAMGHSGRWFGMVPALAARYRVIRPDLRGHGASQVPGPDQALDMDRLMQDVIDLMAEIGIDEALFIGNSAGGYIAQNLAIAHPGRVQGMCLFGSTPGLKNTSAGGWIERIGTEGLRAFLERTIDYRFDPERTDPGQIGWFLDEAEKNDVAWLGRFIGLMASLDWSDRLHAITCPTCLVIPGRETASGERSYAAMQAAIPDLRTVLIEDAAHNICDVMPDRCAAIALEFFGNRALPAPG